MAAGHASREPRHGRGGLALLALVATCLPARAAAGEELRAVSLSYAIERTPAGLAAHEGEEVRVAGVVTAAASSFFTDIQKIYIQDAEAGLCVFSRAALAPVRPGDQVEVEGRLRGYAGIVQLDPTSLRIVGRGEAPPARLVAPDALLSPALSGLLVETTSTVVGEAAQNAGAFNVSLAAGDGLLVLHLTRRQAAAFPLEIFRRGATVRVRGIASQFDRRAPYDAGWQILPREPTDVGLVRAPPLFTKSDIALGAGLAGVAFALVFAWTSVVQVQVRRRTKQYREAADTLAAANRRLEEAVRQRDEVVSIVAHDFRSPLTVIRGNAEWLQARATDPDARKMLGVIARHAAELADLAAGTLTSARLEAGSLPLERAPLDLRELVRSYVEDRRPQHQGRVLLDEGEGPLAVLGDRERLTQVVDNLVGNALKFGAAATPVRLAVRATDAGAGVEVTNEGPSIPPEDVARLFQKFVRLRDAEERRIAGTGLGLYICRAIVEAHGGSVGASSKDGTTSFRFLLPAAPPAGDAGARTAPAG